ncbi:hypothetical protein ABK040_007542 [Willaertia magna]
MSMINELTEKHEQQQESIPVEGPHLDPYFYLVNTTNGKGIRSKLIDAFNIWLKVPKEQLEIIKNIIDKLHNASLLIDDIEDNSKLRRGKPCAHLIFGTPATINSANYVYFQALKDVKELAGKNNVIDNNASDNNTEMAGSCLMRAITVFMDELLLLHEGQGLDIHWRDNAICPSEEEYLVMVKNKTGGLFRLGVGLMKSVSPQVIIGKKKKGEEEELNVIPLVDDLAILFQILDDYLNLQSTTYHINKSFCEDITEGKFSYPIIHCIQKQALKGDRKMLNILKQRTSDALLKNYAIELMMETNSLEYTKEKLINVKKEIMEHVKRLGGNESLERIVDHLLAQMNEK